MSTLTDNDNTFSFDFSDENFEVLSGLVTDETGIQLPANKKTMMYTRLVRRLRVLNLNDFQSYVDKVKAEVQAGSQDELMFVVNAMTTNVTSFFREAHHFEDLKAHIKELAQTEKRISIWSSASSTGEEPWSIAMVAMDCMKEIEGLKIDITASDLDSDVLQKAVKGEYILEPEVVSQQPYLKKWLKHVGSVENSIMNEEVYRVDDKLKHLVQFKRINLLKDWSHGAQKFNVIFCRNVIIYFSKDTQKDIFARMHKQLLPQGRLYLGHSESLLGVSDEFELEGRTIYKRKD